MSRAMICLGLAAWLLAACRGGEAVRDTLPLGTPTLGPVPYVMDTTPTATARPPLGEQSLSEAEIMQWGERIYAVNCAPCHQSNGEGNLATFPPLNRSAFVTLRAPEPVIDTVLHGRQLMPAFAPTLTDAEVAAVLSYIRNSWNNDASFVKADQVEALRSNELGTAANDAAQN